MQNMYHTICFVNVKKVQAKEKSTSPQKKATTEEISKAKATDSKPAESEMKKAAKTKKATKSTISS